MKTLIGGIIAVVLGVVGLVVWFGDFLIVLAGSVPAILLLAGILAIYLGYDEMKDSWEKKDETVPADISADKERIAELEKELEEMKNQKQ